MPTALRGHAILPVNMATPSSGHGTLEIIREQSMSNLYPIEELQRVSADTFSAPLPPVLAALRLARYSVIPHKPHGNHRNEVPPAVSAPHQARHLFVPSWRPRATRDLFDYKPLLNEQNGQQLARPHRGGQRHRHVGPTSIDPARRLTL